MMVASSSATRAAMARNARADMGYGKGKTEGGHKRGHSATAHWTGHDEIKVETRTRRRIESRGIEAAALDDHAPLGRSAGTRPGRTGAAQDTPPVGEAAWHKAGRSPRADR